MPETQRSSHPKSFLRRVRLKPDGTWWRMGGEVKGKLANGVGSQYSHTTSEHGVSSITNADAHTSAASSRLNWRPRRFKWTRPFRRKTKPGFCACAITFQTQSTFFCLRSLDRLIVNIMNLTGCLNKDLQKPFQYSSPKHTLNWSATIIT
jgi:hypothetical protein